MSFERVFEYFPLLAPLQARENLIGRRQDVSIRCSLAFFIACYSITGKQGAKELIV